MTILWVLFPIILMLRSVSVESEDSQNARDDTVADPGSGYYSDSVVNAHSDSNHAQDSDQGDDKGSACRVAVCFSGHIRSFVYPVVHRSIRQNLVEEIGAQEGCRVDIFAYATLSDTVAKHKHNTAFTPNIVDVEAAMAVLAPNTLEWHQEQAGIIPSSCAGPEKYHNSTVSHDDGGHSAIPWLQDYVEAATPSLYWQLYKSLAAYRMATREEEREGFRYDWIVRARFDTAWARPLPPLHLFSRETVWFGSQFWPMSDHFALVPRAFADRFFNAISTFYACDGVSWPPTAWWWTPACEKSGFEESVLFRYLHLVGIPYRHYSRFEYNQARAGGGGLCKTGAGEYRTICNVLDVSSTLSPASNDATTCFDTLSHWADLRCRELFPAGGLNDSRRADLILDADPTAWEKLIVSPTPPLSTAPAGDSAGAQTGEPEATDGTNVNVKEAVTGGREAETPTETIPSGVPHFTKVPLGAELDRARADLIALRDAIRIPRPLPAGDPYDREKRGNYRGGFSQRRRWDRFEATPPVRVWSPSDKCGLGQFADRAPHLVSYFTMGSALIYELAKVVKCHLHLLAGGRDGLGGAQFDDTSCEGLRPLGEVMIDISLHVEELGICTADPTSGQHFRDQVAAFFAEPERHCVGYDRLTPETE